MNSKSETFIDNISKDNEIVIDSKHRQDPNLYVIEANLICS